MKQSIYCFKDGGRREYAEFYAKESARLYGDWIKRKDIQAIIPIPIHRHKRYKRGYNQAEVYAKELGKQCGLPIDSKTLIRVVDTLPQKTLSFFYCNRIWRRAYKKGFKNRRRWCTMEKSISGG